MKATIDIPDELYRQVKAKSALQGQAVREVAMNLFKSWITETDDTPERTPLHAANQPLPAWFGAARKYAQVVQHHDMATIRNSIARGRITKKKTVTERRDP